MGRRQVSGQQNVSYSTSTRRETWSHVTTDKLTVAYAAQTMSNFGANREFRTSICLGDTAGKLAGTMERISSPWIQPGTRSSLVNIFYPGSYWNFSSSFASNLPFQCSIFSFVSSSYPGISFPSRKNYSRLILTS